MVLQQAFITALSANPQQSYMQLLQGLRQILKAKYSQKPQLSSSHPMVRPFFLVRLSILSLSPFYSSSSGLLLFSLSLFYGRCSSWEGCGLMCSCLGLDMEQDTNLLFIC